MQPKVVISGSIDFQNEFMRLIRSFESKGCEVIDYPRLSDNLTEEYPILLSDYFRNIEAADIFYLLNLEKNGVTGYIGAASFSELAYAVSQNLIHDKHIAIILAEKPSESVQCSPEIELWLQYDWLTIDSVKEG
ncbi:hypothetical protein [Candidatus Enterococcus ferrettii]|uniref:Nucleoside 2-deoxyribosyltransferase n=1 Tax=Candidatus Enterococcus ferrettii TaxID=2815324 RepID=A0ABV0EQ65_9ENTE|nr:hypothetical protein [Enterococcus sp. 665A]MBO1339294.1 hypothetical protein [Enterococcus sp. 665A]